MGGIGQDARELSIANKFEIADDGCWNWTGATTGGSYPRPVIRVNRERKLVSRYLFEMFDNPVPAWMTVDHICRNRMCINPDHLEVVTLQENIRRAMPDKHKRNGRWV